MTFEEYERQKAEGMNVDIRKIDQPKDFIEFVKTAKKIVALAK
jgi:hypothetical protein